VHLIQETKRDRKIKPTLLHVAYATAISSLRWIASTLASVAPFDPTRFVDRIQSCGRAEAQMSILVVAPIDGHTRLVLVAQGLQLCFASAPFPQRWQLLADGFTRLCSVNAPSRAQV